MALDWKATMTLYDISTEHDYDGIAFSIFRPKDNIPEVHAADVVLLFHVKVSYPEGQRTHLHFSKTGSAGSKME
jgi:hypothetical protein